MALCSITCTAHALTIEFDYRYDLRGFFTDLETGIARADRRAVLEHAAGFYADFSDQLSAIEPAPGASWSVRFTHPSFAGPPVTLRDEAVPANTIRIFVGGSNSAPGVLGFAGSGFDLQASGSEAFVSAVFARGQGNTRGESATDYGPWGGFLWLNASYDWYAGLDPAGLSDGRPDLLTTAAHEIGHLLGIGDADAWRAQVIDGHFVGPASVATYGATVPLDALNMHWADGVFSIVGESAQETLMDSVDPSGCARTADPARLRGPARYRLDAGARAPAIDVVARAYCRRRSWPAAAPRPRAFVPCVNAEPRPAC
ncbi:MAG: hypothetical protein QM756_29850 [Polyangiaceae bacterium]